MSMHSLLYLCHLASLNCTNKMNCEGRTSPASSLYSRAGQKASTVTSPKTTAQGCLLSRDHASGDGYTLAIKSWCKSYIHKTGTWRSWKDLWLRR